MGGDVLCAVGPVAGRGAGTFQGRHRRFPARCFALRRRNGGVCAGQRRRSHCGGVQRGTCRQFGGRRRCLHRAVGTGRHGPFGRACDGECGFGAHGTHDGGGLCPCARFLVAGRRVPDGTCGACSRRCGAGHGTPLHGAAHAHGRPGGTDFCPRPVAIVCPGGCGAATRGRRAAFFALRRPHFHPRRTACAGAGGECGGAQ